MNCPYCPHHCALKEGQVGLCGARWNQGGESLPVKPWAVSSLALDPVEKKPLYHFYPGKTILSVGGVGCNMRCFFCQNHEISMTPAQGADTRDLSPRQLRDMAVSLVSRGNIGVAFTYNEPMVNFELIRDTGALLREAGLKTAVITNGCFTLDALGQVLPVADAFNIDLKGFTPVWYRRLGGGLGNSKNLHPGGGPKSPCGDHHPDCPRGKRRGGGDGRPGRLARLVGQQHPPAPEPLLSPLPCLFSPHPKGHHGKTAGYRGKAPVPCVSGQYMNQIKTNPSRYANGRGNLLFDLRYLL